MLSTGNQTGKMRHINHQISTDSVSNFSKTSKIYLPWISRASGDNQFWLAIQSQTFCFIIINQAGIFTHTILNSIKQLARHRNFCSMRQMTAGVQAHTHNRVTRIQQSKINRHISLRTGMRLHINILSLKYFFSTFLSQRFDFINKFAAAIITMRRIPFGIFIGQNRTLRFHNRTRHNIFAGNKLNLFALAFQFFLNNIVNISVFCLQTMFKIHFIPPYPVYPNVADDVRLRIRQP